MDERLRDRDERATAGDGPAVGSRRSRTRAPAVPVVAILGGIGSGKSAVAAEFASHGASVVDADALGHAALREPAAREALVSKFGAAILDVRGEIDRKKLGAVVFGDPTRRKELEAVVHPLIKSRIAEQIESARGRGAPLVVLDAAVLLEAGWDGAVDHRIFVDAPEEVRWRRVEQRGWAREDWLARESAQLPLTEKRRNADHVLDNSSSRQHLARQVSELIRLWSTPSDSS